MYVATNLLTEKSVDNSNLGGKFSALNYWRIIQILARNFPLLLPTEKSIGKFVGKENLNYRRILPTDFSVDK